MQRWRVPLGFLCGALFVLFARPRAWTLAIGGLVALLGLALRAWAAGHIERSELASGLMHIAHPLYLGSFLLGVGFTVASGQVLLGLLFAALFLGIYLPVMRVESATLAGLFGEDFARYSSAVPLFLPRLLPYRDVERPAVKFDASLYLRYREYRAALGLVVACSLLALKAVFVK